MFCEISVVKLVDGSDVFVFIGLLYNIFQWMMGLVNMSLFGMVMKEEMIVIVNDLQE